MSYRPRALERKVRELVRDWDAVLVTGPRQAGKTSLLGHLTAALFGSAEARTIAFDTPREQDAFRRDPELFFANHDVPLFLDEVQHVPDLFPYLKRELDRHAGGFRFFLSGSQHFHLMRGITESLAGRVAVFDLWPFAVQELHGADAVATTRLLEHPSSLRERIGGAYPCSDTGDVFPAMLAGGYPPVALGLPPTDWFEAYRRTFIRRDIRDLSQVADLGRFDRFVVLCAGRTGTLLAKSELANSLGIDNKTVDHWLSLLETSYQVLRVPAYHTNTTKRLVKRPKLHFADIGLALHLQAIRDPAAILGAPHFGSLFESFVVMEIRKLFGHAGLPWNGHHWSVPRGPEVDLVFPVGGRLVPIEIRHTASPRARDLRGLAAFRRTFGDLAPWGVLISLSPRVEQLDEHVLHLPLGLLLRGVEGRVVPARIDPELG